MPSINIGGGASTTIGLGMGTGSLFGTYTTGFNPGSMQSFVPFTSSGRLAQGMNTIKNSYSQFNQFLQTQQQQMYGGTSNVKATPNITETSSIEKKPNSGGLPGEDQSAKLSKIMDTAGGLMNIANSAIFANSDSNRSVEDLSASNIRSSVSDLMLKSGNPYVMAAGLLAKGGDAIMDATGMRSNQISKKTQEKTGITGAARFLNNTMNFIPGNPLAMGGKKITNAEISQEAENLRGAFTGTLDDMDAAQSIGGSRINFMLSGSTRNTMDNYVKEQNRRNEILTNMSRTNTLRKQNNSAQEVNSQNINRFNGNTYQNLAVGKEGLKLPNREMLDAIYAKRVTSFKDGGVIGVDSNVIPEGALHKELNHMEEYNKDLDKVITDKGIAVVTTDKDGKVEQVAEIEKEEIVFRLELTKKIEELWHSGSQEAMLKAGKLLVKEIMGNTDDNTEEILDGDD